MVVAPTGAVKVISLSPVSRAASSDQEWLNGMVPDAPERALVQSMSPMMS